MLYKASRGPTSVSGPQAYNRPDQHPVDRGNRPAIILRCQLLYSEECVAFSAPWDDDEEGKQEEEEEQQQEQQHDEEEEEEERREEEEERREEERAEDVPATPKMV